MTLNFLEKFRTKPENAAKATAETASHRSNARIGRSTTYYAKLHLALRAPFEVMNDPVAGYLFMMLLWESFEQHGKPFKLPARRVLRIPDLTDMKRVRCKLRKLEQAGLIATASQPPKPTLIQVPLVL